MMMKKLNKVLPFLLTLPSWLWLVLFLVTVNGATVAEAAPTPPPMSSRIPNAAQAMTNPTLYDRYMMAQVQYWANIGDQIQQKITAKEDDPASFTDDKKFWKFVEENDIVFNKYQSQYLCLHLKSDKHEPDEEVAPNWPDSGWPECDGVFDTMFGRGAAEFLNDNRDDERVIKMYSYYLGAMGILPQEVQDTINEAVGDGDVELITRDQHGRVCSTAGDGIATVDPQECNYMCIATKVIFGLLEGAAAAIVAATAGNPTFQNIIVASLILYVTIYGVMVTMGLINVGIGDAVMRVVKMAIVAMLISSETIHTLFHLFRCFFMEGTTYLVNVVMLAGIETATELGLTQGGFELVEPVYTPGGGPEICSNSLASEGGGPLTVFDALLAQVFSGHMWKVLIAVFLSGLKGIVMAFFMIVALVFLIWALVMAVTTYLMAIVAQYLLLSLMPFFIAFILFESTKDLFRGWVNQLLAASLTPIFLFAFVSLFIVMLLAAMASILDTPICLKVWPQWPLWEVKFWTFADLTNGPDDVRWLRNPPFGYFDILVLIIIGYLLKESVRTIELLAREFADSYVELSGLAGALRSWFGSAAKGVGKGSKLLAGAGAKGAMATARGGAHVARFGGRMVGDGAQKVGGAIQSTSGYQKVSGAVTGAAGAVAGVAGTVAGAVRGGVSAMGDRVPQPVKNAYRTANRAGQKVASGGRRVKVAAGKVRRAGGYVRDTWRETGSSKD